MGEPTILVVDDTDRVRAITVDILGGAGFKVREARDGAEALALANDAPDLIVLDVRMPGMDGFEVCRRLKQTPTTATIPVLYLSAAHRDEHDRVHGLTTGGAAYLTRPIEPSDLVSTVRTLLRLREAQQDPAHPERMQWLFQHATDGVWIEGNDGRITFANRPLAAMLAAEVDDLIGRQFVDFVDAAEREGVQQQLARDHGLARIDDVRCWRKDGTDLWAIVSVVPLPGDGGARRGVLGVLIDVTERKRTEEGLLRLASIVESSNDAIVATTLDGIVLSWNPAARTMYGYTAAEAIGRSISIIVPRDRHRELMDILAAVRGGRGVSHVEMIRRHKDGSTLNVSVSISPIEDRAGRVIGVSTIARDVTDRKRAETAEREAAALRAVATLTSVAAQDIQDPLMVVLGTLESMARELAGDATFERRLEHARSAADDVLTILRRMGRISRLAPSNSAGAPMLDSKASNPNAGSA